MDNQYQNEDQKLTVIEKITSALTENLELNKFFNLIITALDDYFRAEIYLLLIKNDDRYQIIEQYSNLNVKLLIDFEFEKNNLLSLIKYDKKKENSILFKVIKGLLKKNLSNVNIRLNSIRFLSINDTDFLISINYPQKKFPHKEIDYIQTLIQFFNYYINSLRNKNYIIHQEEIEKNLLHYFSPSLISKLTHDFMNDYEESEVEVVILFTDVRNFVSLTEKRSPIETVNLLNTYLRKIVNIIIQNYGNIDKYIGDAVCAYWGFPEKHKNDSLLAVLTAFAIQQEINSLKSKGFLPEDFFVGIGIHKGPAIVGNIGADERLELSLIGDSVLLAENLCDIAPPNEIIISNDMIGDIQKYASIEPFNKEVIDLKTRTIPSYKIDFLKKNHYDILMEAL